MEHWKKVVFVIAVIVSLVAACSGGPTPTPEGAVGIPQDAAAVAAERGLTPADMYGGAENIHAIRPDRSVHHVRVGRPERADAGDRRAVDAHPANDRCLHARVVAGIRLTAARR